MEHSEPQQEEQTMKTKGTFPVYRTVMIAISVLLAVWIAIIYMQEHNQQALPILGKASSFSLPSTQGTMFSLEQAQGKVRLLYFFFASCPDVCPVTTKSLSDIQGRLKSLQLFSDQVKMIQVTIDPVRDTIERLRAYQKQFSVDTNGWIFLRGEEQEAKKIAESYGVAVLKDAKTGAFLHANTVVLIDQDGRIRKRYTGSVLDEESIIADIRAVLADS